MSEAVATQVETKVEETATEVKPVETVEAKKEEAKVEAALRKYKLQVNGKEEEREFSDEEVIKHIQKGMAADSKFQEAAQTRKEVMEFLELSKQDPRLFFKQTGLDPKEWATQLLLQEIELEAMPPVERELMTVKQKNAMYEEQEQKRAAETAKVEADARKAQQRQQLDTEVATEMSKFPAIPKTEFAVGRVAAYLVDGFERGVNITVAQATALVNEDYINERKKTLSETPEEELLEMFSEEKRRKLNDAYVKKHVKSQEGVITKQTTLAPQNKSPKGKTWDEMMAESKRRLGIE